MTDILKDLEVEKFGKLKRIPKQYGQDKAVSVSAYWHEQLAGRKLSDSSALIRMDRGRLQGVRSK